ncbi:MAG: hypothetical protein ACLGSD_06760 [Acidobacteriota bacterium]
MTCTAAAILLLPFAAVAQTANEPATAAPIREIDDPNSGARWLLYASPDGGPGRLILATIAPDVHREKGSIAPILPQPVIRAGDRVVLEEHTAVVDARLDAVALGPAAPGGALRVRLSIGGRVIPAVALAPGHAEIGPQQEPQP